MIHGERHTAAPIRCAMLGGGRGSQIGYIHRCAVLRDRNFDLVAGAFDLVAGAFDLDPERRSTDASSYGIPRLWFVRSQVSDVAEEIAARGQADPAFGDLTSLLRRLVC